MKKNLCILILTVLTVTSCKKVDMKSASAEPANRKYDCTCTIVNTYVDHCGIDSTLQTSEIYSAERSSAENSCRRQNATTSSASVNTVKTCELK